MNQNPIAHRDREVSSHDHEIAIPELDDFVKRGLLTEVYATLTSGKEGTVYCCRAHPSTRCRFIAAKVYRKHAARSIRRGLYFEGRERGMKGRELRAVQKGTELGHQIMAGMWVHAEYDALHRLKQAGADVPEPIAQCDRVILMEYIGNGAGPAPHLHSADLDTDTAHRYFALILHNIEIMLSEHLIHGDLSAYNILMWKNRPCIIDLPQAVDVRFNRNAFELLQRDLENVCRFFASHGVVSSAIDLATSLWERYQRALL